MLSRVPRASAGPVKDDLRFGTTRRAHVDGLIASVDGAVSVVRERLRESKRIGAVEREALSRQLAGVIGNCETLRIWLASGAPR